MWSGPCLSPRHLYGRFKPVSCCASSFKLRARFISLSLLSLFPKLFLAVNPASRLGNSSRCNRDAYGGASIKGDTESMPLSPASAAAMFSNHVAKIFSTLHHRSFHFSSEFWWSFQLIFFPAIDFLVVLVKVTCSIESRDNDQQSLTGLHKKATGWRTWLHGNPSHCLVYI